MTDISRRMLTNEMDLCGVQHADALHITSWDLNHCRSSQLPDLLALARPIMIETPGYTPDGDNARKSQEIIAAYIADRHQDNRPKLLTIVTPEYIGSLENDKRSRVQ